MPLVNIDYTNLYRQPFQYTIALLSFKKKCFFGLNRLESGFNSTLNEMYQVYFVNIPVVNRERYILNASLIKYKFDSMVFKMGLIRRSRGKRLLMLLHKTNMFLKYFNY